MGKVFTSIQRAYLILCQARIRYVISAALLLAGGSVASSFNNGRQSTFICPITSGLGPYMKSARLFSVFLDSIILIAAAELCRDHGRSLDGKRKASPLPWGFCLLVSSLLDWHRGLFLTILTGSRVCVVDCWHCHSQEESYRYPRS